MWLQVEITLEEFRNQVSKPPKETGFWLPLDRCVNPMRTRPEWADILMPHQGCSAQLLRVPRVCKYCLAAPRAQPLL
jgi:hypothetical protein